jgi:hypothetical protein
VLSEISLSHKDKYGISLICGISGKEIKDIKVNLGLLGMWKREREGDKKDE